MSTVLRILGLLELIEEKISEVDNTSEAMREILIDRSKGIVTKLQSIKVTPLSSGQAVGVASQSFLDDSSSAIVKTPIKTWTIDTFVVSNDKLWGQGKSISSFLETFPPCNITLDLVDLTWFKEPTFANWLKIMGSNIIKLSFENFGTKINLEEDVYPIIFKYCRNLHHLSIKGNFGPGSAKSPFSEETDISLNESTLLSPVHHLELEFVENIQAVQQILPLTKNLKSLSILELASDIFEPLTEYDPAISKHCFPSLEKLEFSINEEDINNLPEILLLFDFSNLTELQVTFYEEEKFSTAFLNVFKHTQLKKLNLKIITTKCIDPNDYKPIVLPQMDKLEEFIYHMVFEEEISNKQKSKRQKTDFEPQMKIFFSFANVCNKMSNLKSLKLIGEPYLETRSYNNKKCNTAECTHIQDFFTPEQDEDEEADEEDIHSSLEILSLSCSFRKVSQIPQLVNGLPNLKNLTIWIHSNQLKTFFEALLPLAKLEILCIKVSKSVEDFPAAINSTLYKFKNLKELSFSPQYLIECSPPRIFDVGSSASGFAKSKSLESLCFENMKINTDQMETLRKELIQSNPELSLAFLLNE